MRNTIKVKALIISLIMVINVLLFTTVSRAYSVDGKLTYSGELVAGQNVTVTLSLSNIDADTGLTGVSVDKVSYDTSVFETITSSNFSGSNGWEVTGFSTTSQSLTLKNDSHITANGSVITLTLKVKDGVAATSSTVEFEGIVATAGLTTGDINVGTKKVTIGSDEAPESGSEAGTPANTPAPVTINNTTKNTTKNITSSKSKTKIPAAGDTTTIVITAAVAVIAIVGIVGFVKYAKNKDIK